MNNLKLTGAILVSFMVGIVVSQTILHRDKGQKGGHQEAIHKEEQDDEGPKEHAHEEGDDHGGAVNLTLDARSQELIDVKTKIAQSQVFQKNIPVVGQIAQDAKSSTHVVSTVMGTISESRAEIGSLVREGDVLCVVEMVNGETSRHEVKAPINGIVIGVFGKVADKVDAVSTIYTIADLTELWAIFDVYEKDIADVRVGQKVVANSVAYPDTSFEGEITFVSPRVDEHSRTIKIRALIKNPKNMLKLGMFVNADIVVRSDSSSIILPSTAVYTIGEKKIVFVKTAADKFDVRSVHVLDEDRQQLALAKGVSEGEEVVVENGFLLKSEFLKSEMGEGCAE